MKYNSRSSHSQMFYKTTGVIENRANFTGKHQETRWRDFKRHRKQQETQVFSCEVGKIFKNTCFHRTPPLPISELGPNFGQ